MMLKELWWLPHIIACFSLAGMLVLGVMLYQQQTELASFNLLLGQLSTRLDSESVKNTVQLKAEVDAPATSAAVITPSNTQTQTQTSTDSLAQIKALEKQLDELKKQITSQQNCCQKTTAPSTPQEYYVYLGTGATTNRDWTDLPSALAKIDTQKYGQIKEVRFESALSIIGGEAHARLVNKANHALIGGSEISHNNNVATLVTSSAINLIPGNVEYMVQLKSSSGEMANLASARIKIITQ